MKTIVITGSTRGIGFGLANAFLERGCNVTISGRSRPGVNKALRTLSGKVGGERLYGQPCDVTVLTQVEALWEGTVARFGQVDIWINNAGIGHPVEPLWTLPPETVAAVMETNILGTLNGARVAINGMLAQGHGQLFNMEGMGARGDIREGLSAYGTSKAAVRYLTKALIAETSDTPLLVGSISPGMVVTDLVLDQLKGDPEAFERSRGILNIVTDRVETVTPYLADEVLANEKSGTRVVWLTRWRLLWRFLSAPFSKRDVYSGEM